MIKGCIKFFKQKTIHDFDAKKTLYLTEYHLSLSQLHVIPRGRSLEESMIFQTYNRFRISDSSKDFLESYGELA